MLIGILDGNILIDYESFELSDINKSQLFFWGFINSKNRFYTEYKEELFFKVVQYFTSDNKTPSLSKEAQKYLTQTREKLQNFESFRRKALEYKNGKFDKREFSNFRKFTIESIQRSLKFHQLKASFHSYILGNSANFSVPGSGKTTVVLTVYEKLRLEGKVNMLFVVGPPACFGPWKAEFFETLGRNSDAVVLAGGVKAKRTKRYYDHSTLKAELYLTTFQSILSDKTEAKYFLKQKGVKAFLVVDEAHYIKQINGNWAKAILDQSSSAKYRCVLTGTPMPKSYTDIFNLFDFLWPQSSPISSRQKTLIKLNENSGNLHSLKNILDEQIGPLFYRVRKSDLNLTKQNFIAPDLIAMNKIERTIYDAILKRIKGYSKNEYFKNIEFVNRLGRGRMIRLRQAISYPRLLSTAIDDYDEKLFDDILDLKKLIRNYDSLETTAKMEHLLSKVRRLSMDGQKVVIWSNFIGTIRLIEKKIRNEGMVCKKIFGQTPVEGTSRTVEETREKIREEFTDPSSGLDILIANPAACAESISLHKTCHHAIYYDLNYNCAQYLQSLDRIHRVGGSELIIANYHFLQYQNTIDVDIKTNLDKKAKKMYDIIEKDYPVYSWDMFEGEGDSEAYRRLFSKTK